MDDSLIQIRNAITGLLQPTVLSVMMRESALRGSSVRPYTLRTLRIIPHY